jgi:hypothetical protein
LWHNDQLPSHVSLDGNCKLESDYEKRKAKDNNFLQNT